LPGPRELANAEIAFSNAIKAKADFVEAHIALGYALQMQSKLPAAVAAYQQYLVLQKKRNELPAAPPAVFALKIKGFGVDASEAFAHYHLALALSSLGQAEDAFAEYQEAIKVEPNFAQAHCNLGHQLCARGQYVKALEHLRKGHELGIKLRGWKYPSEKWITNLEQLVSVSEKELANVHDEKSLREGIEGKLTHDHLFDTQPQTRQSFRQGHAVRLIAGKSYQIDLTGEFDTYLRIEDVNFQRLAFNNDVSSPGNLNSRLVFSPAKDGVYRLIVTTYQSGATGSYKLKLDEVVKAGDALTIMDSFAKTDKTYQGRFFRHHKAKLVAGRAYTIQLESQQIKTHLTLFDPTATNRFAVRGGIPVGDVSQARIDFTPLETAEYVIGVVSSSPGQTGDYTIRVQEFRSLSQE
jgi:tetratricopeptide (TPR) repeat protein